MLRILLCDDEPVFLQELKDILSDEILHEPYSFACFATGAECVAAVQGGFLPDVALVDIALPDMDGISAAAQIYQCCPSIPFIFITAYNSRYSQQVFLRDVNLCGYLTKPVDREILRAQLARALRGRGKDVFLKVGTAQNAIYLTTSEILYVESQKHYLDVHTADSVYRYRAKLNQIEPVLEKDFFRIHNSYLVNMAHVRQLLGSEIVLNNGLKLPLSRSMAKAARLKFIRYRGMNL